MMQSKKPSWWLCYLIWGLMVVLAVVDYWTPLPNAVHATLAVGLIVVCGVLSVGWVYANRKLLAHEDEESSGNT